MLLNIALTLHVVLVLFGLIYNFYQFCQLTPKLQRITEFKFTWFGKAAFISLLVLLYRIGG